MSQVFSPVTLATFLLTGAAALADSSVLLLSNESLLVETGGQLRFIDIDHARLADGGVWVFGEARTDGCSGACGGSGDQRVAWLPPGGRFGHAHVAESPSSFPGVIVLGGPLQEFAYDPAEGGVAYTRVRGANDELWTVSQEGFHTPVVVGGSSAPGRQPGDGPVGTFTGPRIADDVGFAGDDLYYSGALELGGATTPANDTGIWRRRGVATRLVVREGDPAPGVPGTVLGAIGYRLEGVLIIGQTPSYTASFAASEAGLAFQAKIEIPGFDFVNEYGLWADRGAGPELVTRTSLPAPGLGDAVFAPFTSSGLVISGFSPNAFSEPAWDRDGRLYFTANTTGGGPGHDGFWRETPSGLDTARRLDAMMVRGAEAPGILAPAERGTAVFERFGDQDDFAVSGTGWALVTADVDIQQPRLDEFGFEYLTSRRREAAFLIDPDGLAALIALGETTEASNFADIALYDPTVNNRGQAAWASSHYDGVEERSWLSATAPGGRAMQLVATGDTIDVGTTSSPDERVVIGLQLLDFDDAGRVLYEARFDDSTSALIVSTAATLDPIDGDYNGDGLIDHTDYDHWAHNYGATVPVGADADGNRDGRVDAADFVFLRDLLSSQSARATPEPTSLLLTAALAAVVARRGTFGLAGGRGP